MSSRPTSTAGKRQAAAARGHRAELLAQL
jgi:DNA-binding MarR family transcriptional regulator